MFVIEFNGDVCLKNSHWMSVRSDGMVLERLTVRS